MARMRLNAEEQNLGREREFNINEIGSGDVEIEAIERNLDSKLIENEAFMAEPVTVMLADSTDPNDADVLVQVSVNGRNQYFARGYPQTVKRMYVERLARSKKTGYSQNLDERLGEEKFNLMRSHNALRYPFTVVEDKNPRGAAWLRAILAERN